MGWLDKVKQGMGKAAEEAEDIAAIAKLRLEIRTLHGKVEETIGAIGDKVYDLHEAGNPVPGEVAELCQTADRLTAEIKAKETEIEKIKAEG